MNNSNHSIEQFDKHRNATYDVSSKCYNSINGSNKSLRIKTPSLKNTQTIEYKGKGEVVFSMKSTCNNDGNLFNEKFFQKDSIFKQSDYTYWRNHPDMKKYVEIEDQNAIIERKNELSKIKESSEWKKYEWSKPVRKRSCSIANSLKSLPHSSSELPLSKRKNVNFKEYIREIGITADPKEKGIMKDKKETKNIDDIMKTIDLERKQFKTEYPKSQMPILKEHFSTLQKGINLLKENEVYQKEKFKVKKAAHKRCFSENFKIGPEDIEDMVKRKTQEKSICPKNLYEQQSKKKFMRYDNDADPKLQNDKKIEEHYTGLFFENRHKIYEKLGIPKERYPYLDPDVTSPQVKEFATVEREHIVNLENKEKNEVNLKEYKKAMSQLLYKVDDDTKQTGNIKTRLGYPKNWPERAKFYNDIKRNIYNDHKLENNKTDVNFKKILAQNNKESFERKNIKYDLYRASKNFQSFNSSLKFDSQKNSTIKMSDEANTLKSDSVAFTKTFSHWKNTTKYPLGCFDRNPYQKLSTSVKNSTFSQTSNDFNITSNFLASLQKQNTYENTRFSQLISSEGFHGRKESKGNSEGNVNYEECVMSDLDGLKNSQEFSKSLALNKTNQINGSPIYGIDTVNLSSENDENTLVKNACFDSMVRTNPAYNKRYNLITKKSVSEIRNWVEGPRYEEPEEGENYQSQQDNLGDNITLTGSTKFGDLKKMMKEKQKKPIPYEEKKEWKVKGRNQIRIFDGYASNMMHSSSLTFKGPSQQKNSFNVGKAPVYFGK